MSAWPRRTVLVTGAGGFVGSHLTERLAELGARTRALVRYSSTGSWGHLDRSPAKDEIQVFMGDVTDAGSLKPAFTGVDTVFHLAALIAIPYSYAAPSSYVRTNVQGTLNVLQTALDAGGKLVVHTSTSEVYGTARAVPIGEGHPLQGQSPYAASKIGADKMAEAFHRSFGLPVATIRPFNTFGPRQSARAVIPTLITQALTQNQLSLGNLDPLRDFTYVTDTVEGFIRIAECPAAVGRVVNIGSGQEISVGDLAKAVMALLGRELPVVTDAQRVRPADSEVDRLCADTALARSLLGWEPRVSLKEGLAQTIEWVRDHLAAYRTGTYAV